MMHDNDTTLVPMPIRLAERWFERRTFKGDDLPSVDELCARKRAMGATISVGIPVLNEEATIGDICAVIGRALMGSSPLVDELVVLDGDSSDETVERAEAAGARVVDVSRIMPGIARVPGKGESLWRSLATMSGDIVVWIDGDIRNFGPHFVTRLIAPLLIDPGLVFVKGYYERPIEVGGVRAPTGGGRVTELLARPLLTHLFPELAAFLQPLAGEYAGRAEVLRRLPFFSGYSVEVGLLIDLLHDVGLDRMAQVDLGRRVHRNRPLDELRAMSSAIATTILRRAEECGRIRAHVNFPHPHLVRGADGKLERELCRELERPPIDVMRLHPASSLGEQVGG